MKSASEIISALNGLNIRRDVNMSAYTSFRIGGPAALFIEPADAEELKRAVEVLNRFGAAFTVIGNGTNLLVSDKGFDGAVIRLAENFSSFTFDGCNAHVLCGTSLSALANRSLDLGLTGLEWASGIPGSFGGAIAMNAGAYGGEIKQVLRRVCYLENGTLIERDVASDDLGYRKSVFSFPDRIVISGELTLAPDTAGTAKQLRDQYNASRREKQPLTYPSAGSTFKRPPDNFAGSLIEKTGLKGFTVGGAQVSQKHAGFVINLGNATADDVYTLIKEVKRRVLDAHGIALEPEIKLIGEFNNTL